MPAMNYVKEKKQRNKDLRDLVTGLLHVIGPQLAKVGDDKSLKLLRELAAHLNNLSVQQVKYATVAIEKARKHHKRHELPREIIFELLRKDWYEKK